MLSLVDDVRTFFRTTGNYFYIPNLQSSTPNLEGHTTT